MSEGVPENWLWRFEVGVAISELGLLHHRTGQFQAAERAYRQARRIFDEVPERRLVPFENHVARNDLDSREKALLADKEAIPS